MKLAARPAESAAFVPALPRLGFVGLGWIGTHRLKSIRDSQLAQIVALADPDPQMRQHAAALVPRAQLVSDMKDLWSLELDALVIATPSALHAEQSLQALAGGMAVFCQKPLGRNAQETQLVVQRAREVDRLLGVDFCYRHTRALQALAQLVRSGELGDVFAADLVFHNAYGPDKDWFYRPALSGGGCVMDLGSHLVDALLWLLDFPEVERVHSRIYGGGRPLAPRSPDSSPSGVEDYATARLDLATGAVARLACSWNLCAGQEADIAIQLYGTRGGASMYNLNGSFYDFALDHLIGTQRRRLVDPPDAWGGVAAVQFVQQLSSNRRYDLRAEQIVAVARVLDAIYQAR